MEEREDILEISTQSVQVPVYCARCYHSLCIPLAHHSTEEDETSLSDSANENGKDEYSSDSDEDSPIFKEDPEDIEEMFLDEIADYMKSNPLIIWRTSFEKELVKSISTLFFEEWLEDNICEEYDYPEIQDWVKQMADYYFRSESDIPPRQGGAPKPLTPLRKASIANKLRILEQVTYPSQRTQEWYEERYRLITASNAWKAIGSEAQQNQLIVEKCIPFDKFKEDCSRHGNLSSDNPMAWGQKYERISAIIYERRNKTRLGDYGCIVHPEWSFLGASPDGINVDPESSVYGRMVEIKNIVNRNIDGVPLDAYWVQMQIQMEVCDLDECDFVETRIKEYPSKQEYMDSTNTCKGIVLTFVPRITIEHTMKRTANQSSVPELKPFYEYFLLDEEDIGNGSGDKEESWIQSMKERWYPGYVLSNTSYWGLDQYSCVLVKRNRVWIENAIPRIERIWKTIEKERVTGCEHRAPKKREVKQTANIQITKLPENASIIINKCVDENINELK